MNPGNLSYFALASRRLDWLSARQKAVSENIANADTPGARAKDVIGFEDFLSQVRGKRSGEDGEPDMLKTDDSWMQAPDGNNISLEQQTILANQTAQDHGLASRLYSKAHQMLILAGSGS